MVVEVRHFQEPKAGSEPDECEDALAWDTLSLTFAIADGAAQVAAVAQFWIDHDGLFAQADRHAARGGDAQLAQITVFGNDPDVACF